MLRRRAARPPSKQLAVTGDPLAMVTALRSRARIHHLAGLGLLVLALIYFGALVRYGLNIEDEGTILYQIFRTYLGQRPHIEFQAGYTPGLFYWNAALFWLFGVNAIVLRVCLAFVNSLTVFCIYVLARQLGASVANASCGALVYLAFIPFYDGHFAASNVPYPVWYVTLFWLVSVICTLRWWKTGRGHHWLLAGAAAGCAFSFKPNSGLLNLTGLLIALCLLQAPRPAEGESGLRRWLARQERVIRLLIPIGLTLGWTFLFKRGASGSSREVYLFALPLLVLVAARLGFAGRRAEVRSVAPLAVWRDLLLLGTGFSVIALPWFIYFWVEMGTTPFLRAILFIGSKFERFYFVPYPPLGLWEDALALAFVAAWIFGWSLRRRRIPRSLFALAVLAAMALGSGWLLRHPPRMIEGFQASVAMRVQSLAFGLILLTEWWAIVAHVIALAPVNAAAPNDGVRKSSDTRARQWPIPAAGSALFVVLLAGTLMHMQLYPRTDFMHLVPASPGILIVGAWLFEGLGRSAALGLARSRSGRFALRTSLSVVVALLVLILITPAARRIEYLMGAWWRQDDTALVHLDAERAPLVIEPAAGQTFRSLGATARYVREHSRPNDFVFTFPALDVVLFLAGGQNPSRHGYFFPGSPGREVEAEVIDSLKERPPRYIVTLHDHSLFFSTAPLYYFNLRQYVTTHYVLEHSIGKFDILTPAAVSGAGGPVEREPENPLAETIRLWRAELRGGGNGSDELEKALGVFPITTPAELAKVIAAVKPVQEEALARLVRKSRSKAGAAALATAVRDDALPDTIFELFARIIGEIGDLQSMLPLVEALSAADVTQRPAIAVDLFMLASRASFEDYWYVPPKRDRYAPLAQVVGAEQLITWIENPWELFTLRSFGVRSAGWLGKRLVVPFLMRIVADATEPAQLRVDAARSLMDLGFGPQVFRAIAGLLRVDELAPPVLAVELYPQVPDMGAEVIAEYMRAEAVDTRVKAFWIAAAVHDPKLSAALQEGLADPVPEVRMAAAWALGNMREAASLEALQALAGGGDEVAGYAARAVAEIQHADAAGQ